MKNFSAENQSFLDQTIDKFPELCSIGLLYTILAKSNNKQLFEMGIMSNRIRLVQFVAGLLFSSGYNVPENKPIIKWFPVSSLTLF